CHDINKKNSFERMSEEDIGAHSSSLPLFHGVFFVYFTYCLSMYIRSAFIMPMILPRFYVSTSKSIIKALINMHSFEIQLSPIG
ncbi:hypothetical protein EHV06_24985, partial [Escherichia coli]|nr:hypothetical protein [Escherichia coli]